MMSDTLKDGKGRGYLAGVNSANQLVTRSTNVEQRLKSTLDEQYFEVSTGSVTLTTANETGLIYLKNDRTDDLQLVIDRVFFDFWASTGGSTDGTLKYYINPTVTGGTTVTPVNTNFGSTVGSGITCKKSVTSIDTGSVWWTGEFLESTAIALEEGRIVLPSGSSFAISVAAPASNTSMAVSINVAFYLFDKELVE